MIKNGYIQFSQPSMRDILGYKNFEGNDKK
jgi:hypothetical protein